MTPSLPIESVVRVATTPAQAKIFVAMLEAEGIPARTDGDTLTDEFAASRRLMNLIGTKVFVPTASLARAQEILRPVAVDAAELEREALATPGETAFAPRAGTGAAAGRSSLTGSLLVVAICAAVLFAWLWRVAQADRVVLAAQLPPHSSQTEYRSNGDSWREVRRRDDRTLRVLHDAGRDGNYERIDTLGPDGAIVATAEELADGFYTRIAEKSADGMTRTWVDVQPDGVVDRCTVTCRRSSGRTVAAT
jgi:hypothetical protein